MKIQTHYLSAKVFAFEHFRAKLVCSSLVDLGEEVSVILLTEQSKGAFICMQSHENVLHIPCRQHLSCRRVLKFLDINRNNLLKAMS